MPIGYKDGEHFHYYIYDTDPRSEYEKRTGISMKESIQRMYDRAKREKRIKCLKILAIIVGIISGVTLLLKVRKSEE